MLDCMLEEDVFADPLREAYDYLNPSWHLEDCMSFDDWLVELEKENECCLDF